jgi:hypothetical protein
MIQIPNTFYASDAINQIYLEYPFQLTYYVPYSAVPIYPYQF